MERPIYHVLAASLNARENCKRSGNTEWYEKHADRIEHIVKEHFPSGSGFDSGTKIDLDASDENKLVFITSYHHMNESGYYTGWTEHKVIVTCDLMGLKIKVTGRNRNDINNYIGDIFHEILNRRI